MSVEIHAHHQFRRAFMADGAQIALVAANGPDVIDVFIGEFQPAFGAGHGLLDLADNDLEFLEVHQVQCIEKEPNEQEQFALISVFLRPFLCPSLEPIQRLQVKILQR